MRLLLFAFSPSTLVTLWWACAGSCCLAGCLAENVALDLLFWLISPSFLQLSHLLLLACGPATETPTGAIFPATTALESLELWRGHLQAFLSIFGSQVELWGQSCPIRPFSPFFRKIIKII